MNDPKTLAKLLLAIAGGENAKEAKQDVILNAAADMLEAIDVDQTPRPSSNRHEVRVFFIHKPEV